MKNYKNIILITLFLFFSGCNSLLNPTKIQNYNAKQDLKEAKEHVTTGIKEISGSADKIGERAKEIKKEVNAASDKVPEESKSAINPHLNIVKENSDKIVEESENIKTSSAKLSEAEQHLCDAESKIKNMQKDIDLIVSERDKVIKERDKAIEEKNSQMHKMLRGLIIGCIGLLGVCVSVFLLTRSKIGLIGAMGCGIVLVIAIFVQTYLIQLAIAGGVILLILLGVLIYNVFVQKKAFLEVVNTVEVAQDNLDPEKRDALFGGPGETGIMDTIQSKETMTLVKDAKKDMSKLWYYAKNRSHNNGTSK